MKSVCPSWSFSTKSCLLSTDGLYLPVAEHIGVYCEGGGYLSCPQSMNLHAAAEADCRLAAERRRTRRTPVRLFTRIIECPSTTQREQDISGAAVAVDLSPDGIRVELCQSLAEGTNIMFSLDAASSGTPVHGSGQVRWCRSMDNSSFFHVGIQLTDKAAAAEIARRIDQIYS